jgi:putative restriction endonuclease
MLQTFIPRSVSDIRREQIVADGDRPHDNEDLVYEVNEALGQMQALASNDEVPSLTDEADTHNYSVKARDAAFAMAVKRLYGNRCAICGVGAIGPRGQTEVEAAHFYPKALNGSDDVRNGICLCRRHHWAIDVGWWALSDEYRVLVRDGVPEDDDYDFIRVWQGQLVQLPQCEKLRPHVTYIEAHRKLAGLGSCGIRNGGCHSP